MGEQRLHADMVGTVLDVSVAEGTTVAAGETVLMIESMKMEIPVPASSAGTVTSIAVTPGQTVREGDLLAVVTSVE